MSINERVKKVREYVGMTQAEFAREIGKTAASITKNESGETNPRGKTLNAIIEEFGVSRKWLQTGDGEMFDVIAKESESASASSWSEKAHEALKAHNDHLTKQVEFLQDMLRRALPSAPSENFQDDIVLAAKVVNLGPFGGNIVRAA